MSEQTLLWSNSAAEMNIKRAEAKILAVHTNVPEIERRPDYNAER